MDNPEVVFVICESMSDDDAMEYAGQWSGENAVCFINEKPVLVYFSNDEGLWYTVGGCPVPASVKKYKLSAKA